MPELGGFDAPVPSGKAKGSSAHLEEQAHDVDDDLTPEQLQMFEKENQDMLKHYEATLDQVKYVICPAILFYTDEPIERLRNHCWKSRNYKLSW